MITNVNFHDVVKPMIIPQSNVHIVFNSEHNFSIPPDI